MAESSSAPPKSNGEKPVIVRVKRKSCQSPLYAFWLEINERPSKRQLLDFEKLSIADSSAVTVEEAKTKKVFVQHVDTVNSSAVVFDVLRSYVSNSADAVKGKLKSEDRKQSFKKDNKQDQLLSKARQTQEVLAKNARFEQIWRSRRENIVVPHDKELHDMCHFYDVVRVDVEESSNEVKQQEVLSLEDQRILSSYLPLLREFIPSAAEDIESDIGDYMSQQGADDYVYDYYAVKDDMDMDNGDAPFPLVQVEDEDFYDGLDDESDYDSVDSNAEAHPRNDYPDETSEDELESDESSNDSEEQESEGAEECESDINSSRASGFEDLMDGLLDDADQLDEIYDYFNNGDNFDYHDEDDASDGEDLR